MTLDRDPMADRLVEAWLDEGPRTFAPGRLDRVLADIHATPQRRQRPLPWSIPRMNPRFLTAFAGAAVLAFLLAAGALLPWLPATILGPATTPTPLPGPSGSPSPIVAPAPTFLTGDVPFEGTDWLLVGRSDVDWGARTGGPAFVTPGVQAWLRVTDGAWTGSDGCYRFDGVWDALPEGDRSTPLQLAPVVRGSNTGCTVKPDIEATIIEMFLDKAGAFQMDRGGYDLLASGLTDADLDPELLAHYRANPDLVRLIIRDQSGEGTLVYAPVAPGYVHTPPTVGFVGPVWGLAGYGIDGVPTDNPVGARTAAMRFAVDGTFATSVGCGPVTGRWGVAEDPGTTRWGPWVVDQESVPEECAVEGAPAMLDALRSVDVSTITVTTDLRAEVPAAWHDMFSGLTAPRDRTWLVLRDGDGDPAMLYLQLADDEASPEPLPAKRFELIGPLWSLAAWWDGTAAQLPSNARDQWLRFAVDGRFRAGTGCGEMDGQWARTVDGTLQRLPTLEGQYQRAALSCLISENEANSIPDHLFGAADEELTTTIATALPSTWLDRLDRLQGWEDRTYLIIRDAAGEPRLVYTLLTEDELAPSVSPAAASPASSPSPAGPDLADLIGSTWGVAGYRTDAGLVATGDPDTITVRFDADGTFSAADGCGTLGGVWGLAMTADGPPVAGETDVDVSREWCMDDASQEVLRVLQGLDLAAGVQATTDLVTAFGAEPVPDGLAARYAERAGSEWRLLRDEDGRIAAVLLPASQPLPTVEPAPSLPPVALLEGETPVADTTWMVVGLLARTEDPAAELVYRSVDAGIRPWIRQDATGWTVGDVGCERFAARPPDGTDASLVSIIDVISDPTRCTDAQTRTAMRISSLLRQAMSTEVSERGLGSLEGGDRPWSMDAGLSAHLDANPAVAHLALLDSNGLPLLILAPVDGGLPGVPGSDPAIDPAPTGASLVNLDLARAAPQDGAWQLIGWRDASGHLRLAVGEDPATIKLEGSGAVRGSTGCGAIEGSWRIDGGPDDRGIQRAEVTLDVAPGSDGVCASELLARDAEIADAPIGGLRFGPELVEAMRIQGELATMDPWLWAWLAATPQLPTLVLTDGDGAPQLIFEPVAE